MTDTTDIDLPKFIESIGFEKFCYLFLKVWAPTTHQYVPLKLWDWQVKAQELVNHSDAFLILKARRLGMSALWGAYAIFKAITTPHTDLIIISQKLDDAVYFLRAHIIDRLKNLPELSDLRWTDYTDTKQEIAFANDTYITAMASTGSVGRGRECCLVIIDEAGTVETLEAMIGSAKPTLELSKGKLIILGTSEPGSYFNTLTKAVFEDQEKGEPTAWDALFVPWWAQPSRSKEWYEKEAKAYTNHSTFLAHYPAKWQDAFLSREGAVFASYDDTVGGRHVGELDIQNPINWTLVLGYDHGYAHASACIFAMHHKYHDLLYIVDEVYAEETEAKDLGEMIKLIVQGLRKAYNLSPTITVADTSIFARLGERTTAEVLTQYSGLHWTPAYKFDRDGSLTHLQLRVSETKIKIHPSCTNLRREMREYSWDPKKDQPKKINDHAIDALRYLNTELYRQTPPKEAMKPEAYSYQKKERREEFRKLLVQTEGMEYDPHAWMAG